MHKLTDRVRHIHLALYPLLFLLCLPATAMADKETLSLESVLSEPGLKQGFVHVWYQAEKDKSYLVVPKDIGDFIYQTSLPHGLGSNDVGLDRGQLGSTRLVSFQPAGNSVLMVQHNTDYRALSDNPMEIKAIADSFANAILWRFPLKDQNDNYWLLDASEFLLQDTHDVVDRLKARKQGSFKLDKSRSAVAGEYFKSFPNNTELEAWLTFVGSEPGRFVRQVAIDPKNVSLRIRHSLVKLPEPGYEPLKYHPKSGYFAYSFADYAQPVNQPITQQYIPRHRLEKKDPEAEMSEAVEPIIYYLDPGVPEPVRSALLEGARWWGQAFEAIGYKDAYQVKILPEGADPMDVRYNIIQWVHRATRGWSYGASVVDPRTGEIIKGHVSLGSLRIRQDYLIAQAMMAPFPGEELEDSALKQLAIDRIEQLSAHEVGHTLGLAHNFAASSYGRASVMDYPHPLFEIKNGKIHADNAYTQEIGIWDKRAIAYAYGHFPEDQAQQKRAELLEENDKLGFWFISDADSRDISDAHPSANLWDNGENAVDELARVIELRKTALANFGEANLHDQRPYSDLEEILVPAYYFHRYQAIAAGKSIGGYQYNYDIKGQDKLNHAAVSPEQQQQALSVLMQTLQPEFLAIPDEVATLVAPKVHYSYRDRESINGDMGVLFDRFTLAAASTQHTLNIIMDNQRLMRLAQQHSIDVRQISVGQLLRQIYQNQVEQNHKGMLGELQRQNLALMHSNFLNKLHDSKTPKRLQQEYFAILQQAHKLMESMGVSGDHSRLSREFAKFEAHRIEQLLEAENWAIISLPKMPPGSPI